MGLAVLMLLCLGCNDNKNWFNFSESLGNGMKPVKPATIDRSEFKNGQLIIGGSCGEEGEILLILPTTAGDDRIIASPRCRNGRYQVTTSKFGRPPCGVIVEYDGDKEVRASVSGTEVYCH